MADERATVLFYRDFRYLTGGHLKVWHYFQHVESSGSHRPVIRFSNTSVLSGDNPWLARPDAVLGRRSRIRPQVLFLAGLDWRSLSPRRRDRPGVPVVNLIQHVRHGDANDPRHAFLCHPAVRICVSPEVATAIQSTGEVRGPVVTIENAIDLDGRAPLPSSVDRPVDVIVVGTKQPEMARSLARRLSRPNRRVELVDHLLPRAEFLAALGTARQGVFLPGRTEGFFLPALEAMALGTLVICPDCIGNRSFCVDGETCWLPPFELDAIVAAAEAALVADVRTVAEIRRRAFAQAARHSLEGERRAFLDVLAELPQLWDVTR